MVGQLIEWQVLIDVLPDVIARLDVERHPRHDADGSKRNNRSCEVGVVAVEVLELSAGSHELKARDCGRQAPVASTRSVRPRRAGAGHRDVGERTEVVQREPVGLESGCHLGIAHACRHGDRGPIGRDLDERGELGRRDEVTAGVGDRVEGVRGA